MVDSNHFVGAIKTTEVSLLTDGNSFIDFVQLVIEQAGATCLKADMYAFNTDEGQMGFTAVLLLAESHIAIHTWPEYGVAELDVYLCNYRSDNRKKCEYIFDNIAGFFKPTDTLKDKVIRPVANSIGVFQHATTGVR